MNCTIRDLGKVAEVASKHFGIDATLWVREKLYSPIDKLFFFDENLVIYVEGIGQYKYSLHLLGSTSKIVECRNFIIKVGSWIFDNTICTCLVVFAPISNKRLQRFIGLTGGKRVGILPDANGTEDEIIYVYPKSDRKEFERRNTWQQL